MPALSSQRLERIEQLVAEADGLEDQRSRSLVVELLQLVMELHGEGLRRMVEILEAAPVGASDPLLRITADSQTAGLLLLHGLHPDDLPTRVERALQKVRPYLQSHEGGVEIVEIDDAGRVQLQMQGSCDGCPSSAATLKMAIEEALYEFAPDLADLNVAGVVAPPSPGGFVPVESLSLEFAAAE